MLNKELKSIIVIIILILPGQVIFAQDNNSSTQVEFYGFFGGDFRYFHDKALYEGQYDTYFSSIFKPQVFIESKNEKHQIHFMGFARLDQYDDKRTHADIRDLYWRYAQSKWEINTGFKIITWGKTESNHLVDIINQYDLVEGRSLKNKLGQPMVQFIYSPLWASMEFYIMPYARRLQFPGRKGRLQPGFNIKYDDAVFETENADLKPDIAIRLSKSVGNFDFAISNFQGTSRLPLFEKKNNDFITPYYEEINQLGLEFQWITGALIWRAEAINLHSNRQTVQAFTVGGEYNIYFHAGPELKWIIEFTYDERNEEQISGINNDVFIGLIFNFNDSQSTNFRVTGFHDLDYGSSTINSSIERRFGDSWKVNAAYNGFVNTDPNDFFYLIRNDSFIELAVYKYF